MSKSTTFIGPHGGKLLYGKQYLHKTVKNKTLNKDVHLIISWDAYSAANPDWQPYIQYVPVPDEPKSILDDMEEEPAIKTAELVAEDFIDFEGDVELGAPATVTDVVAEEEVAIEEPAEEEATPLTVEEYKAFITEKKSNTQMINLIKKKTGIKPRKSCLRSTLINRMVELYKEELEG